MLNRPIAYRSRRVFTFAGMTTLLLLSGCISGAKPPDSYTDRNGKTTLIETDRESCTRSCNESNARCMDTEPAQNNSGLREDPSMFGAKADCRNDLRSCLSDCNVQ